MCFGLDCITRSLHVSISPLIEQGTVNDWDRLETFMAHTILSCGMTASKSLLLSQSFGQNHKNRCKLAEVGFESLGLDYFQFSQPAENVLYANGLITGTVIDIGECHTSVTPIYEGVPIPHAQQRSMVGGLLLSDFLI
jgi:actin-related protein 2